MQTFGQAPQVGLYEGWVEDSLKVVGLERAAACSCSAALQNGLSALRSSPSRRASWSVKSTR